MLVDLVNDVVNGRAALGVKASKRYMLLATFVITLISKATYCQK